MKIFNILGKIDYFLTRTMFSRPDFQAELLIGKLRELSKNKVENILDVGGGSGRYKPLLLSLAKQYYNLEISRKPNVNIVGTVYDIPLDKQSLDIIVLFTVFEHLNQPRKALDECARVLKKGGYIGLTTVQYWHTHNHPSDYLRYTKAGLQYFCKAAGFKIIRIWSIGGPFLVIFHAIELNLTSTWRTIFSICFYRIFDWLDWIVFKHEDKREHPDSLGWSVIARKL